MHRLRNTFVSQAGRFFLLGGASCPVVDAFFCSSSGDAFFAASRVVVVDRVTAFLVVVRGRVAFVLVDVANFLLATSVFGRVFFTT
jgi:hypothetical protein